MIPIKTPPAGKCSKLLRRLIGQVSDNELVASLSEDLRLAHVKISELEAQCLEYKLINTTLGERLARYESGVKFEPQSLADVEPARAARIPRGGNLFAAWRDQVIDQGALNNVAVGRENVFLNEGVQVAAWPAGVAPDPLNMVGDPDER